MVKERWIIYSNCLAEAINIIWFDLIWVRLHCCPVRLHCCPVRLHCCPVRLHCCPVRLHCCPVRLHCCLLWEVWLHGVSHTEESDSTVLLTIRSLTLSVTHTEESEFQLIWSNWQDHSNMSIRDLLRINSLKAIGRKCFSAFSLLHRAVTCKQAGQL